jgi:ribosomal protein S18 acetylase RimI-like enzyme
LTLVPPGGERERFIPLLLLADESERQVRSYLQQGDLYAYGVDETVSGIVLAIPLKDGAVELKAVAIEPKEQGRGVGKRMLLAVIDDLRARGLRKAVVGTANAGIGQLAFYQKAGFRLSHIERDFFSPARGYPEAMQDNGIRMRDMVWMDLELR